MTKEVRTSYANIHNQLFEEAFHHPVIEYPPLFNHFNAWAADDTLPEHRFFMPNTVTALQAAQNMLVLERETLERENPDMIRTLGPLDNPEQQHPNELWLRISKAISQAAQGARFR